MAKSKIQKGKYCLITGSTSYLHKHHIFNGPLRSWSESEGMWCYLSANIHEDLHDGSGLSIELKRLAQYEYEKYKSRKEFMEHTRKNYLTTPLTQEEKNKYGVDAQEYDIASDTFKFN